MGAFTRLFVVAISLAVAILIRNYRQLAQPFDIPAVDVNKYWGPGNGENYNEDKAIKLFDITTNPETIEDLIAQLSRPLKLQDPLEGVGFEYGFNSKYLQEVVQYWRDNYLKKWIERESFLKKFPHFETQIQGLRVHFIHVKPKTTDGKKVIPLLLLHGWPGSVREFYDIIPLLTTPNSKSNYVFEVIAPSLPGYGWSQGASKTQLGTAQISIILRNLMLRLGLNKFVVQGGDWGSMIGSDMATLFPDNVLAYHSNMCTSEHPLSRLAQVASFILPQFIVPEKYKEFHKSFGNLFSYIMEESGYMHLQATKPDTIGSALSHNPVGLAAYILEKFSSWTNYDNKALANGGILKSYTLDALLDNVMIYYVTNSITTSVRLYSEQFVGAQVALQLGRVPVKSPVGCARFQHDLIHITDVELKYKFPKLIHSTYYRDGGHFAAFEKPKVLYNDLIEFTNQALKDAV